MSEFDVWGFIPTFLNTGDPRPAREQLNDGYAHGGGWLPMPGFTIDDDLVLHYPGDPPFRPLSVIAFRDETIVMYEHAFVAVIQPDHSFEVSRMD